MKDNVKSAIEEYQCPGCAKGCEVSSCFEPSESQYGESCGGHYPGTFTTGVGRIYLGLPKGFNRLGKQDDMSIRIWNTYKDGTYNMWNVPVWKYKNEKGHTIVRGIMPRRNEAFLDIFLEDCLDQIECQNITLDQIEDMD